MNEIIGFLKPFHEMVLMQPFSGHYHSLSCAQVELQKSVQGECYLGMPIARLHQLVLLLDCNTPPWLLLAFVISMLVFGLREKKKNAGASLAVTL